MEVEKGVLCDVMLYLEAIQNVSPGTGLLVGVDDPRPYIPKSKPPPEEVGLPKEFK